MNFDPNMQQVLVTAVATLSGVVGTMGYWFKSQYAELRKDYKECEASKMLLFERIIRLEERTGIERKTNV